MELLFLEPIFKDRIWGGNKLKTNYGYNIPSNTTGEAWIVSAHRNGDTIIRNGQYAGTSLSKLWRDHPELFANNSTRDFPLMLKVIDAKDKLSVQVHPNDKYAKEHENDLGKCECWYILDAISDAKIIYGHNAYDEQNLRDMITKQHWGKLLKTIPVKTGDFFPVPTGTVHAIGAGTMILEVQQSSDVTYRLYDFDRRDSNGKLRELHLEKAQSVINIPHIDTTQNFEEVNLNEHTVFNPLVVNDYFQVGKLEVNGELDSLKMIVPFMIVSVIKGFGVINGYSVKTGDSFIVPNQVKALKITGTMTLITTSETG